jgi:sugar/nucleoside kinase (ribokinase family)
MNHEILICGNIARDIIFGSERYGGSAAAIAVNTSRLGLSSGLMSVIGKDAFSERYRKYLLRNGVDISFVEINLEKLPECLVSDNSNSTVNVEWIDNESHRAMEKIDVNLNALLKYRLVHMVSCSPGLAKRLAGMGIENLSYEPGPYIYSNSDYLDFDVVNTSKLIFFNEEEFRRALEISGLESPKDFVAGSKRVLIITKASKGSDLYLNTSFGFEHRHVDSVDPEADVVDATGAGDCYKSGFLAGFIRERSIPDCALIGSYMASACLTQKGGILPKTKINEIKVRFHI